MMSTATKIICLTAGLLPALSTGEPSSPTDPAFSSSSSSSGRTSRALEDGANAQFDYDLSGYSVRFGKCQHVKTFSDDMAQDEDTTTVLALKNFVLFRMCPSDQCSSCDQNYGEYVVEIDQYLENMAEFHRERFERRCENCENGCVDASDDDNGANGGDDDDGVTCDFCDDCDVYENMDEYGYVDATEFVECQRLEAAENDDDDGDEGDDAQEEMELYVGPRCSSDGSKIILDIFTDENCGERYDGDEELDLETLMGTKISERFLKDSYSSVGDDCVSCKEGDYFDDDKDKQDGDEVFEMCENIYDMSAKCETKHGFINGYVKQNGYENQVLNEFTVCTFIDSLAWGSYDEKGEINFGATQHVIVRYVTPLQRGMLILLCSTLVGIGMLAYYLQTVIDNLQPVMFESQGGTLT